MWMCVDVWMCVGVCVDVCGCVWMCVDVCGCVWMCVDVCGCVMRGRKTFLMNYFFLDDEVTSLYSFSLFGTPHGSMNMKELKKVLDLLHFIFFIFIFFLLHRNSFFFFLFL